MTLDDGTQRCVECGRPTTNTDGRCDACLFGAEFAEELRQSQQPAPDISVLLEELAQVDGPDEIAGVFAQYQPPADDMAQEVAREKLIRALTGRVKSPARMVDAWLRRAVKVDADKISKMQASVMVQLALKNSVLFHDPDNEPYATIEAGGHRETHHVRKRRFRLWLQKLYFDFAAAGEGDYSPNLFKMLESLLGADSPKTVEVPAAQAVQDALTTLEGLALFQGEEFPVHVRVASFSNEVMYLDLANEEWEVVEITRDGWNVVTDPPVKFIRPEGLRPLPVPVAGGSLDSLRRFVNVTDDDAWALVKGFIVGMLRPRGPYTVLNILGEQGAAKSSAARFIRRIVDPATPIHRARPRNEHDLVIAASRSWVMSFDNLSGLPDWFSDGLCRLSTGGGFGARLLYSDDDEKLFESQRPIILNGIEELATRGDLLDRSILITLPKLEDDGVRTETALEAEFEQAWPELLGAALDGASAALANFDKVELEGRVRMADAACWIVAAEEAIGLEPGEFLDAYQENRQEANALTLEASKVASEFLSFMESCEEWSGTVSQMLTELNLNADDDTKKDKRWPKTARGLSGHLRRLAPALRRAGYELDFTREVSAERTRFLEVHKVGKRPS